MTQITPPPQPLKKRNSSVELYRIIATFTVLIVHFNGWFVGGMPEQYDISNPTFFRTGQMVIEAATCICVNMFIIISGYYRIKLRLSSVVQLSVKLLFIFVPIYIVYSVLYGRFSLLKFIWEFFIISRAGWFIQCYVMLMLLSPLLNSFVENYSRKILSWSITLLLMEFWFGCLMCEQLGLENSFSFNKGYSVIHFVLIYMIGRCIYIYQDDLKKISKHIWMPLWIACTIAICLMHILGLKFVWDYSNPIVVISTIFSFIPFLYKEFYNEKINWLAKSTLAVYIIHSDTPVVDFLMMIDNQLLADYNYLQYLFLASAVIIAVFFFCVAYDKICDIIIKPIMKSIVPLLNGKFEFQ